MITRNWNFRTIARKFPETAKRIHDSWGREEFSNLLRELRSNLGRKPRYEYSNSVLYAIDELADWHKDQYPQFIRHENKLQKPLNFS